MAEKFANVETMVEFVKKYTPCINGETTMECVERSIRNAPTIEAKPVVHAHWEIEKYQAPFDDELQYKITCSKCGYDYCSDEVYCLEYCARCGAQMDESISCSHEDDMM